MSKRFKVNVWFCAFLLVFFSTGQSSKEEDLPKDFDTTIIGSEKGALHIVSTTQCNRGYFTYQAWAQKYTLDMVNQPGNFTRIISCDNPEEITEEDLSYMDTIIVPDWAIHPITGEDYSPYNRPVALMYWLAERKPTAEWTLIVDPDMLFIQPFLLKDFQVPEGYAVAARYNYMKGAHNELADIHVPQVKPRQDEYGGPKGRKADLAGAFYLIRTRDLVKVAPLWLKYTEDLRADPRTITYTGVPEQAGQKEWASEMYGYIFAAAAVDVWHKLEAATMYYPDYGPSDIPIVVHYGLNHTLGDFHFDKHEHMDFNAMKCPPWNLDFHRDQKDDGGLFPHPPFPDVVPELPPRDKYGKLLVIEVVNTLNKALCTRHRKRCLPSKELDKECRKVDAIGAALRVEFEKLHVPGVICHDNSESCKQWAKDGACERIYGYMIDNCREACNWCRPYIPRQDEVLLTSYMKNTENTEDLKEQAQPFAKQEELDSKEVLRCQKLDRESFLSDSKCRRLVRSGFIQLDWPQTRPSFGTTIKTPMHLAYRCLFRYLL